MANQWENRLSVYLKVSVFQSMTLCGILNSNSLKSNLIAVCLKCHEVKFYSSQFLVYITDISVGLGRCCHPIWVTVDLMLSPTQTGLCVRETTGRASIPATTCHQPHPGYQITIKGIMASIWVPSTVYPIPLIMRVCSLRVLPRTSTPHEGSG